MKRFGELPLDLRHERKQGPLQNPGAGLYPDWINEYRTTLTAAQIDTNGQAIIPANPLRAYLLVQNKDAATDLYFNISNAADAFNGIIIIPRGNYEYVGGANGGSFVPSGTVYLTSAAGTIDVAVVEGILPPTEQRTGGT